MIYWKTDFYLSLILIILSIIVFIESLRLPKIPSYFPRLLSILLLITAVILTMSALRRRGKEVKKVKKKEYNYYQLGAVVGSLILYILILRWLGYLLSTGLLIIWLISTSGYPKRKQIIIISIIAVVALYIIFKLILNVPLPMGIFAGE